MQKATAGHGDRATRLYRRMAAPLQTSCPRAQAYCGSCRPQRLVHHGRQDCRLCGRSPGRHHSLNPLARRRPRASAKSMAVILPLAEAAAYFPPRGVLLGLDLGTKTIGVAGSDPDRKLATGIETIARKTFSADAQRLLALAAERSAVGLVLGLPINMDGSEGPRAQSTRAFARNLAKLTTLPIALWDERLSTAAVERQLIEADVSRRKRAAAVDQHAAAFILQGALDRLARL